MSTTTNHLQPCGPGARQPSRFPWLKLPLATAAAISWLVIAYPGVVAYAEEEAAAVTTPLATPQPQTRGQTAAPNTEVAQAGQLQNAQTGPEGQADVAAYCNTIYFAAKRGSSWLASMQRSDGLFTYGWIPDLNRPLEEDNMLRQAGAAAALARAATVSRNPEMLMQSGQATLVMLTTYTEVDPKNPAIRRPTLPPVEANPVGFSALLLLAISEMPQTTDKMLDQGEQLARFIESRQRADGSIDIGVSLDADGPEPIGGIDYYPGEALYALMRSYANRPEPWKVAVVEKAFKFYSKHFETNPEPAFVPWQSAAYCELFLLTAEPDYAKFVFAMNDWMITLQYANEERWPAAWIGGYGSFEANHLVWTPPGITTASFAEGMVEAYRTAKLAGDLERVRLYRHSLEISIEFLMNSQYRMSRDTHLQAWYAKKLNGAFPASVEDGRLRIDQNQHAINAMFHYLTHVAEFENPDQRRFHIAPETPTAN